MGVLVHKLPAGRSLEAGRKESRVLTASFLFVTVPWLASPLYLGHSPFRVALSIHIFLSRSLWSLLLFVPQWLAMVTTSCSELMTLAFTPFTSEVSNNDPISTGPDKNIEIVPEGPDAATLLIGKVSTLSQQYVYTCSCECHRTRSWAGKNEAMQSLPNLGLA